MAEKRQFFMDNLDYIRQVNYKNFFLLRSISIHKLPLPLPHLLTLIPRITCKLYNLHASPQGRNWGGAPLLNFILLIRTEDQHILHCGNGHVLSHPSYYKYTCAPLSKLPSCAPVNAHIAQLLNFIFLLTGCS